MKLRTSFFNLTAFRKNLTRFAPLWILASVFQALLLLMIVSREADLVAAQLADIPGPMALYNLGYALICAACLFGDLFNSRMCNALHAMPMKREGWLLTNIASGAIFALIPAAVGALCGVALTREFYQVTLLWQAASLLQFAVFFGMAVFCAMCAGTRLGMFGLYGVLNMTPLLLYVMSYYFYEPLLYGVKLDYDPFLVFTPFLQLFTMRFVYFDAGKMGSRFQGCEPTAWGYLWICVAVGVVLLVAAWLIYRRRHLEKAGEFVTVKPMRYVFLTVFALGVATFLYAIFDLFLGQTNYFILAIGLVVGYFGGFMLLERSVKVFRLKVMGGFAALCLVFLATFGITAADPLGIVSYVPPTDSIERAYIFQSGAYLYSEDSDADTLSYGDTAEEIAAVRQIHEAAVEAGKPYRMWSTVYSKIHYVMKDGSVLERYYHIPTEGDVGGILEEYFNDYRNVFRVGSREELMNRLGDVNVTSLKHDNWMENRLTEAETQTLVDAILQDCQEGNFAQDGNFHPNDGVCYYVDMEFRRPTGDKRVLLTYLDTIYVYETSIHTIAYLDTLNWKQ